MLFSPPKSFYLPSYAENLAREFVNAASPVPSYRKRFNSIVETFIDLEAEKDNGRFSASEGSSSPSI